MSWIQVPGEEAPPRWRVLPAVGRVAASFAIVAGLLGAPATASALSDGLLGDVTPTAGDKSAFSWADGAVPVSNARSALPQRFDLREEFGGAVTSVKLQNPWSTCWAFGVVAASEASIRSEAYQKGISLPEQLSDLSERHLSWFAYTPIPEGDDSGQGGEGVVNMDSLEPGTQSQRLGSGGLMVFGTSLFSARLGPLTEELVPYRGAEGNIEYSDGVPFCYSRDDDWSVDEYYRFVHSIEIEETYQLPAPSLYASLDESMQSVYLEAANDAIKGQLLEGRGVSIAFMADQSEPDDITEEGYINPTTWAHYTYDNPGISHAVTIVGWDDTYPKENFGNPDHETGEVDPSHRPAGDGAWIVKNSWGSGSEKFPNSGKVEGWGLDEDGDGKGDGYFYLSYYDKTIIMPEAFDFDIENVNVDYEWTDVHAYDYMPTANTVSAPLPQTARMANVFTAGADEQVRKLACDTSMPNMQVTFDVYALGEGASDPTDGMKLATVEKTFEYAGFHTVELTEEQAFTLREGERFAVVVTQYCLDNDMYYIIYDWGPGKSVDDGDRVYFEAVVNEGESFLYTFTPDESGTGGAFAWEDYKELADSRASEEGAECDNLPIKAYAYPVDEGYTDPATEESLQELRLLRGSGNELQESTVESTDGSDVPEDRYWVDSGLYAEFVAAMMESEDVLASDEPVQGVVDRVTRALEGTIAEVEGARQPGLLASAERTGQLEDDIKTAQSALLAVAVSADGKDIAPGASWVTQAAHDAFAAAIAAAEQAVGAESPTAVDIEAARSALAEASAAFDAAKAAGLKVDGRQPEGQGPGTTDSGKKPAKGGLPKTGDVSLFAAGAVSLVGLGTAAAGAILRRRK